MALIICPECGKEYSDRAAACPNCACPTEQAENRPKNIMAKQEDSFDVKTENSYQEHVRKKALKMEKDQIKQANSRGNLFCGWVALAIGLVSLIIGYWLGALFFGGLGILVLGGAQRNKKRLADLEKLENGYRQVLVCPYCKSTNISSNFVQSGVRQDGQTIRVAKNMNPFHPFTHTNIHTSATDTKLSYGNKYQCIDCGRVFDKVLEVWDD
ncbi:MAG: hypothetical protein E7295_00430 [Lachnospiraceae bacterium]|jgi:hypothetical protein|nr:hypothetical protein [Lachnospiraceae bacterium]